MDKISLRLITPISSIGLNRSAFSPPVVVSQRSCVLIKNVSGVCFSTRPINPKFLITAFAGPSWFVNVYSNFGFVSTLNSSTVFGNHKSRDSIPELNPPLPVVVKPWFKPGPTFSVAKGFTLLFLIPGLTRDWKKSLWFGAPYAHWTLSSGLNNGACSIFLITCEPEPFILSKTVSAIFISYV